MSFDFVTYYKTWHESERKYAQYRTDEGVNEDEVVTMEEVYQRLDLPEIEQLRTIAVVYYRNEAYCLECALMHVFQRSFRAIKWALVEEAFTLPDGQEVVVERTDGIAEHTGPAHDYYPEGEYCNKCEIDLIPPGDRRKYTYTLSFSQPRLASVALHALEKLLGEAREGIKTRVAVIDDEKRFVIEFTCQRLNALVGDRVRSFQGVNYHAVVIEEEE